MFLVPLMLMLVVVGIALFSWAVKNGQYDDLEGPAHRILYDDDIDMIPEEARQDKPGQAETPASEQDDTENKPDQP
ncbi:cbb3-type cytochrome oxidase assembly protein CcoS [Marinobacter aromaticivorans]|uniref:Cbb3-type cytochrome oxidase assembly protein CcoS n=1 Tax=Marinobacter aromaticivorans TaxID=1494078 RepID=A0ABW2IT86_9GAMM